MMKVGYCQHLGSMDGKFTGKLRKKLYFKEKLELSERSYKCECCGIEIDRDYNAALNIRGVRKEMLKY